MSLAPALGNVVYKSGFKNRVQNGGMDIAQRGTSFPAVATGTYTLDRWQWQQVGAGIGTISQQADAPADNEFQNSLRYTVTTADASIAAADVYYLRHAIEGYNVRDLIGRPFVTSFRVRSAKTGVHCVGFLNGAGDRSYVTEYTVLAANTWETKYVVVPAGLLTAGTWNWTTGAGLVVAFPLAAGSNFRATKDAWQTGSLVATSSQVNCMDTVGNVFAVTGVDLEIGTAPTYFDHRSYDQELDMCHRYFSTSAGNLEYHMVPAPGATYASYYRVTFPKQMRAAPVFTPSYSNSNAVGVFNVASVTNQCAIHYISASAATNAYMFFSWTASSDI